VPVGVACRRPSAPAGSATLRRDNRRTGSNTRSRMGAAGGGGRARAGCAAGTIAARDLALHWPRRSSARVGDIRLSTGSPWPTASDAACPGSSRSSSSRRPRCSSHGSEPCPHRGRSSSSSEWDSVFWASVCWGSSSSAPAGSRQVAPSLRHGQHHSVPSARWGSPASLLVLAHVVILVVVEPQYREFVDPRVNFLRAVFLILALLGSHCCCSSPRSLWRETFPAELRVVASWATASLALGVVVFVGLVARVPGRPLQRNRSGRRR
jgi:hypothetical protein